MWIKIYSAIFLRQNSLTPRCHLKKAKINQAAGVKWLPSHEVLGRKISGKCSFLNVLWCELSDHCQGTGHPISNFTRGKWKSYWSFDVYKSKRKKNGNGTNPSESQEYHQKGISFNWLLLKTFTLTVASSLPGDKLAEKWPKTLKIINVLAITIKMYLVFSKYGYKTSWIYQCFSTWRSQPHVGSPRIQMGSPEICGNWIKKKRIKTFSQYI